MCLVFNRKKAHTRGRSLMLSATFSVIRLGGLYHQNSIVTMPMYVALGHFISAYVIVVCFMLIRLIHLQVLGHICYHILAAGLNGYMATITNLKNPLNKWRCGAAPLTVGISFL